MKNLYTPIRWEMCQVHVWAASALIEKPWKLEKVTGPSLMLAMMDIEKITVV